jgi:tetratricopeptide (TPR) repeat protein
MMRHPHFVRFYLIGVLLLVSTPPAAPAEKRPEWSRLRSPNFIVITNASDKQARRVAYQFEMIRSVFRQVFGMQGAAPDPPVIILAAKDAASLLPLLPEAYRQKGAMHPAGFYLGGEEKNYVALRLDASLNQEAYEPFQPIYHEYLHYLMRRSIAVLPLWLTEGLAEFYGNTRGTSKVVWVGVPSSSSLMILHEKQFLPLSTLFSVDASSPYYHEDNKTSIFYAESWALTHYLMTRDWRETTHRLSQFVALLGQKVDPTDAARRTIGDPQALETALRMYIERLGFTAAGFPPPPGIDKNSFVPEPLSDAESLAIRADFLVRNRRYAEARQMLDAALKANPKLAAAYESMGLLHAQQNQIEEANKWYSQAVALNSQSFFANYYYAANLMKGKMDDDAASKAEASLRTAIKADPGFASSYDALALLFITRNRELEEARMLILHAVSLEPGNVHYRLRMAALLVKMDRVDDALRVVDFASPMATSSLERAEVQSAQTNIRLYQQYKQGVQDQKAAWAKMPATTQSAGTEVTIGARSSSDEGQPPVLRHRDDNVANGAEARQKPELLSQLEVATGTVTEINCPHGGRLELTLTLASGPTRLYSDNYFKIPYSALNYTPQGILNPCVDMTGMRAHITYHRTKDDPKQGEIVEVQLLK